MVVAKLNILLLLVGVEVATLAAVAAVLAEC